MKFLVDTHLLLWAAGQPKHLSFEAVALMDSSENELFFSTASLWEIVLKNGLGRVDFRVDVRILRRGLLDNGYRELPIHCEHVVAVETLPLLQKDPFDWVLLAQTMIVGFILLTSDSMVTGYPGAIRKV